MRNELNQVSGKAQNSGLSWKLRTHERAREAGEKAERGEEAGGRKEQAIRDPDVDRISRKLTSG